MSSGEVVMMKKKAKKPIDLATFHASPLSNAPVVESTNWAEDQPEVPMKNINFFFFFFLPICERALYI
jgi:hypothetical protein